jgi:glutathione synthase/RimK-type ligase-like ATP-grasp enzyme
MAWDDESVDWGSFAVCVLRSTWNYVHRLEAFLRWLDDVAEQSVVLNPPHVVRWNLDKRYLRALADRAIPTVPTAWVERGEAFDLGRVVDEHGWDDFVLKPTVGAASFATRRFGRATLTDATAFLRAEVGTRAMMVQPYLESVEGYGERSIVWIAGAFTHAVRKSPRFGGEHESVGAAVPIADDERRLAARILAPIEAELLYARVDLARNRDGNPVLMELEVAEPSLFLVQNPSGLGRFADAIAARAMQRASG